MLPPMMLQGAPLCCRSPRGRRRPPFPPLPPEICCRRRSCDCRSTAAGAREDSLRNPQRSPPLPVANLRQAGDKMFASRSNLISSPSCVPIDHSLLFSALGLAGKGNRLEPWSCSRKGTSLQTAHGKVDGGCSLGGGIVLLFVFRRSISSCYDRKSQILISKNITSIVVFQ